MVTVDLADGGRWTSLKLAGREWLWEGPGLIDGPRTALTTFVDAGGVDECFPTIRGTPDHGTLWNQPWTQTAPHDAATVSRTPSNRSNTASNSTAVPRIPSDRRDTASNGAAVTPTSSVRGDTVSNGAPVCRMPSDRRDTASYGTAVSSTSSDRRDTVSYGAAVSGMSSVRRDTVSYGAATLTRTFTSTPDAVTVDYRLEAVPGYQFIWAAHALLDCSIGATISAPTGTETRLYPEAADLLHSAWPPAAPWVTETWPTQLDLTTYGPTDGTAVGAVLLDCPTISIRDRGAQLTMTLSCPEQPTSTALWRNQGGFPADAPYRSLGVEPMLGRVFDLSEAGPGDAAVVPASGELTWQLTLAAKPV